MSSSTRPKRRTTMPRQRQRVLMRLARLACLPMLGGGFSPQASLNIATRRHCSSARVAARQSVATGAIAARRRAMTSTGAAARRGFRRPRPREMPTDVFASALRTPMPPGYEGGKQQRKDRGGEADFNLNVGKAFRYLVRRHGCDLTYTQMLHSGRFAPDKAHKFREQRFDGVDEEEDRPLIAQFCGNDPDTVVRAARHIEGVVDAVDLNLGCPQRIARKGNYGAFLLSDPHLCERIVATMSRELSVPVTVKIRALEKDADTLDLVRRLEGAGAQLIAVHGRTVRQAKTAQGVANWDIIGKVKRTVSIPVVANGGVETRADAEGLLEATGADAVMSSEGLLEDPSLFDKELTPMSQLQGVEVAHRILSLAAEYMELARRFPTPMVSIKGHLFKMLYRLLDFHHDLRDRLAYYEADQAEADAVVREMCRRYLFDPDTRMPLEGTPGVPEVPISPKRWYRRHWPEQREA